MKSLALVVLLLLASLCISAFADSSVDKYKTIENERLAVEAVAEKASELDVDDNVADMERQLDSVDDADLETADANSVADEEIKKPVSEIAFLPEENSESKRFVVVSPTGEVDGATGEATTGVASEATTGVASEATTGVASEATTGAAVALTTAVVGGAATTGVEQATGAVEDMTSAAGSVGTTAAAAVGTTAAAAAAVGTTAAVVGTTAASDESGATGVLEATTGDVPVVTTGTPSVATTAVRASTTAVVGAATTGVGSTTALAAVNHNVQIILSMRADPSTFDASDFECQMTKAATDSDNCDVLTAHVDALTNLDTTADIPLHKRSDVNLGVTTTFFYVPGGAAPTALVSRITALVNSGQLGNITGYPVTSLTVVQTTTGAVSTTSTSSSGQQVSNVQSSNGANSSLSGGAIAGIVIGVIAVVAIAAAVVAFVIIRRRQRATVLPSTPRDAEAPLITNGYKPVEKKDTTPAEIGLKSEESHTRQSAQLQSEPEPANKLPSLRAPPSVGVERTNELYQP